MTLALYRKYRSATFAELIGQDHVAVTLRNQVRRGETAHAYLFAGVRGTGKTSTARILARAVNCLAQRDGEPCNACPACLEVLRGGAVDVLEIDAASNRGIEEIRDLRERVKFLPASLRRKVYIVDEAHMLTTEAWNAFLKTLEEPPPHVLFVLCTTEPHKVPETVRSRVQRFDFRRVPAAAIAKHLGTVAAREGIEVERAALDVLAGAAQGSVRDGLSLLDQTMATGERPVTLTTVRRALGLADPRAVHDLLRGIARGDAAGALRAIARAFDAGADARQLLRDASRLARSAAARALGADEFLDLVGEEEAVVADLARAPVGLWTEAVERFATAEINLRQPVDARLQVEIAALRLARRETDHEALLDRIRDLERRLDALAERSGPAVSVGGMAASGAGRSPAGASGPSSAGRMATETATRHASTGAEGPASGTAAESAAGTSGAAAEAARTTRPTVRPASVDATRPLAPAAAPGGTPDVAEASSFPKGGAVALGVGGAEETSSPGSDEGQPGEEAVGPWGRWWPAVVEAVSRRDPMLAGVLRSCRPVFGSTDRLVVGAPYGFHLERLQEPQKAALLAEAAAEVSGTACAVEAVFCGTRDQAEASAASRTGAASLGSTDAVLAVFPGSRITGSRLRDVPPASGD